MKYQLTVSTHLTSKQKEKDLYNNDLIEECHSVFQFNNIETYDMFMTEVLSFFDRQKNK